MLETIVSEDFASLVAEPLSVEVGDGRMTLRPVEVRTFPAHPKRAAQPFAVVLEGPPAPLLPQGIYAIHHPARGRMELFLVPISRDERAARYEIVFN